MHRALSHLRSEMVERISNARTMGDMNRWCDNNGALYISCVVTFQFELDRRSEWCPNNGDINRRCSSNGTVLAFCVITPQSGLENRRFYRYPKQSAAWSADATATIFCFSSRHHILGTMVFSKRLREGERDRIDSDSEIERENKMYRDRERANTIESAILLNIVPILSNSYDADVFCQFSCIAMCR